MKFQDLNLGDFANKCSYFWTSLVGTVLRQGLNCSSCGGRGSEIIDSKYGVCRLVRCVECGLQFRIPTTPRVQAEEFYQHSYMDGAQAFLPSPEELKRFQEKGFEGTPLSYAFHVKLLRALGFRSGSRVFDFGCSWGYGSLQFMQAGFDVTAFEVSRPRRDFARERFGVRLCEDLNSVDGVFDLFFSSHVFEHLPSVSEAFDLARRALRPGGMMIILTPNGSEEFRRRNPLAWHRMWGQVHPNFLDSIYYEWALGGMTHLLTSEPYDLDTLPGEWRGMTGRKVLRLDGAELLLLARQGANVA